MCYCSCDLDGPSVYWEAEPVARKIHYCCECDSIIDEGEKYYKIKGVWDGDFSTYKQCLTCREVWLRALYEAPIPECICFGDLWESFWHLYEKRI